MNVYSIAGIALLAVFGALWLRQCSGEFSQLLPVFAIGMLLLSVMPQLLDLIENIRDLSQQAGVENGSLSVVFRGVGIALLTKFASGICYDSGQRTLGETVEYCGQIAVISLALPMILSLAEQFLEIGR